ncbi:10456_t:CDS:2 [Cetraspora pellucida]|uniref:10456_t:CDS:1 n=1 Tax=Cetraspora pellucida TaxID=1433469 RepID=A0A9N9J4L0_9GLOM|nr:10456_t:CDS:2 [Cetraspora pellucida]
MSDLKLRSPEYFQNNENWSLLGYLEYRKTMGDFRSNKADEHFFYVKNLEYIAKKHENKKHCEKAKRVRPIDMSRQMITVVCCQATGMACSAQSSNQKLSSVNSFWLSIYQNNYEERIELEKLRHAESTIRAVNEETEDVRLVSSSETRLLLKRKRQDDINFDKGADKHKTLENKIQTTNRTVVEGSSSNSLSVTSLMQPSNNESQALNEETDSEINSIDEISPDSCTNVSSETSLSQQSHTDTTKVNSSLTSTKEFEEAYTKLDPNCMWTLKSGRKVEEVIYQFARNLPGETCLHSFIINDAHADVKSLFSDVEWEEITVLEVKKNPNLERSLRELMIKYTVRSVKELRKIIYDPFISDGNEFDKSLHHDFDFINYAYRSMLFLWDREENPFDSSKLEGWYEMNIWSKLIDPTFYNINIDLVRGEAMSCASSDRKNFIRTINDRKKIGRKGDGVFRLRGDRLEFGAIEAGRKWEGQNGTKYLNDSLKLNKMMKDMIAQLITICDGREELVRKLEVIGILHGANRIQIITMDYPKGYISRVKHWKFYEVSGRLTKSNPLALVLKEILCAKAIILRTLDLINQKDDVNLENFLNDSDEQDGYHTPPSKVNTTPTFETPKTAKTKSAINKKN